ncbi:MAG: BrnT family toxin [Chloroflexota bacterium]
MIINELEWEDQNIEHIARHIVNPQEVEDVCFGLHISENAGNERYILSGQTAGGRYLNVVIERVGKGLFRPITAFEMSEDYKRRYRKRLRK